MSRSDHGSVAPRAARAGATAGLRGAHWDPARLPSEMTVTVHPLTTVDGAITTGFLYRLGSESTVVCIMHPREFLASHYIVPDILRAGKAVWIQAPRSIGNDLRLEHEIALLDVAAGVLALRDAGFRQVVLLGNSGGAGLYALYNQQASTSSGSRLRLTPGGRPTGLCEAELPSVDGMVFVSPHPGQGRLLQASIDPSVVEESDPLSVDPDLDPFSSSNGYDPHSGGAQYDAAFLGRYAEAQVARVKKLDLVARNLIETKRRARRASKEGLADRETQLRGAHTPIMTVWRTDADPRCWDLSIDPSQRRLGSLWGSDPMVSNWGAVGFARLCTPESWLSTWSALSSRADVVACAPDIVQPALLIDYSGDPCVFPADVAEIFSAIKSAEKLRHTFSGDHHGRPLGPDRENGQRLAGECLADWLTENFA